MRHEIILLAMALAAPAAAQTGDAPSPAAVAATQSGEGLALARVAIDHIWPLGTYARMMNGTVEQMTDSMMASMMDMKVGDLPAGPPGSKPADARLANSTLREVMAKHDPHFEERMRITQRVMTEEMIPVMTRLEPQVREAMVHSYARKFSAAQLTEINRFFATPAGGLYARESMMLFVDPEIMTLMGRMGPELVKEMPRITARLQQATAHLPPPPAAARGRTRR